ncbi:MAG: hypothetical protein JWO77_1653 [Ilumatobacteraceae bacterium]|nr:hypothetical protein [Ilumatobacteraceae bacterium]
MIPSDSASLLISIASGIAAVLALGVTLYQQWWRQPRLRLALSLDPRHGDLVTLTPVTPPDASAEVLERDTVEHWLRMRVTNAVGKQSGREVEVLYIGRRSNGVLNIDPRPLRFTGTSENLNHSDILAMGADKPALTATVPPGMFRQVDVIAASCSTSVMSRLRGAPRVAVWPGPGEPLVEGQHEVFLAVAGADRNAAFYRLDLTVAPGWTDDVAVWWDSHLVLSPLVRIKGRHLPRLGLPPAPGRRG